MASSSLDEQIESAEEKNGKIGLSEFNSISEGDVLNFHDKNSALGMWAIQSKLC